MLPESWIKEEKLEFKDERRASGVRGSGCTPPKYGPFPCEFMQKSKKTIYSNYR